MRLDNIQAICDSLNKSADDNGFFKHTAVEIERKANDFVNGFAEKNGLKAHTVSPDRWWFASDEFGMIADGEVELFPMIKHAIESLHPHDNEVLTKFKAVLVTK